jgi:endonuclease YncB( thermonuclease family)
MVMSFRAIKGTYHVLRYKPDGDSIRFMADNKANWDNLQGRKVKLNNRNHAQLRIEAIDTLETHYKNEHQPWEFARSATDYLFKLTGIKNVVWNDSGSTVTSAADGTPGYIISRTTDRYARPISFLFDASLTFEDDQEIFLDKKLARKSINFKMLSKGLAYPTFYDGMFYDLRELFAKETAKARQAGIGLWAKDTSNKFFSVEKLEDITDGHVLLPKLFRRLVAYLKNHDTFDPKDFKAELAKKPEEILIMSILHFTHFDNIISISKQGKIKLSQKPENLVFLG